MRQQIPAHHSPSSNIDQCTAATYASDTLCQYTGSHLSYTSSSHTFKNDDFKDCSSSNDNGGAIKCTGSNTALIVKGCAFSGCSVRNVNSYCGGAIYAQSIQSVTTQLSVFTSCSAEWGGGLFINDIQRTPDLSECVFSSCKGYDHAAGAFVGRCTKTTSFVACSDSLFIACTNVPGSTFLYGGGFYLDIYANTHANTVSNVLFTKNSVNGQGAGVNIYESEIDLVYSLRFCFFSRNHASDNGHDISMYNIKMISFLHCLTTSDASNRVYLSLPIYETASSRTTTHTPNWLPEGNCHSSLGNRETVKITYP